MPQLSTISYVADLVIQRVLVETGSAPRKDLTRALEEAYPFDEATEARLIWERALVRHSVIEESSAS